MAEFCETTTTTNSSPHFNGQLSTEGQESLASTGEGFPFSSNHTTNCFCLPDCPLSWVTVYLDKAEVCRWARTVLPGGGLSEVAFHRLPPTIDKDSIRVDIKGNAILQDVTFLSHRNPEEDDRNQKNLAELRDKVRRLQQQQIALQAKQRRLEKEKAVLETFANSLITREQDEREVPASSKTPGYSDMYDLRNVGTLSTFLTLYDSQSERLDTGLMETKDQLETTEASLQVLDKELKEADSCSQDHTSRELRLLIESKEATQVDIDLSYVVSHATWQPAYDVRIFNNDGVMKIVYHGMIQQSTGEDWHPKRLFLSTAQPSIGGMVPQLGLQRVHFKYSKTTTPGVPYTPTGKSKVSRSSTIRKSARISSNADSLETSEKTADELELQSPTQQEPFSPSATLHRPDRNHMPSAQFQVPVPPDLIRCNNDPYRATIGVIDLQPHYDYVCVPRRSPYAFLRASSCNTSKFAVLPGPMSIFMGSSFVGKSDMKSVAPLEDFCCDLGAEHSVKVNYKPTFKYREPGNSGKSVSVTFKQVIEIRNTLERSIRLLVIDQLPLSTEEKIKVTLVEPVIKHPEKYDRSKPVRLNRMNNIEWDLELQGGESKELMMKCTVEHPATEEVDFSITET